MKDVFEHMSESSKQLLDVLSVATVLGTLTDMLPSIAATFTIVWTAIRIYETPTVQKLLSKRGKNGPRKD